MRSIYFRIPIRYFGHPTASDSYLSLFFASPCVGGEVDGRLRTSGEGSFLVLRVPDVWRAGQSRHTDVPHPDPLPTTGEGIGTEGNCRERSTRFCARELFLTWGWWILFAGWVGRWCDGCSFAVRRWCGTD
jgi:hypothetical protein